MASVHSLARRFRVRSATRTASSRRLSSVVLLALLVVAAIGAGPVIALSSAGSPTHPSTAGPDSAGSTAAEGAPRSAMAQAALLAGNSSELLQAGSVAHDLTSPASLVEPAVAKANAERAQRAAQLASKRAATHRPSTTRTVYRTTTYHYSGTNHVWIPSLGINRAVYWFPCSRTTDPGMVVYRWGCAGTNNVYLMAHAGGPFYALNRAYYDGRLRVGMKVVYADGSGRVHTYSVIWWRVVRPTTAASWAWASLSRPSMTLQTCLGANSEYRLMVRLVQVS